MVVGEGMYIVGRPLFINRKNPGSVAIANGRKLSLTHRTNSNLSELVSDAAESTAYL